jgi:hypothetical protein
LCAARERLARFLPGGEKLLRRHRSLAPQRDKGCVKRHWGIILARARMHRFIGLAEILLISLQAAL